MSEGGERYFVKGSCLPSGLLVEKEVKEGKHLCFIQLPFLKEKSCLKGLKCKTMVPSYPSTFRHMKCLSTTSYSLLLHTKQCKLYLSFYAPFSLLEWTLFNYLVSFSHLFISLSPLTIWFLERALLTM